MRELLQNAGSLWNELFYSRSAINKKAAVRDSGGGSVVRRFEALDGRSPRQQFASDDLFYRFNLGAKSRAQCARQ